MLLSVIEFYLQGGVNLSRNKEKNKKKQCTPVYKAFRRPRRDKHARARSAGRLDFSRLKVTHVQRACTLSFSFWYLKKIGHDNNPEGQCIQQLSARG